MEEAERERKVIGDTNTYRALYSGAHECHHIAAKEDSTATQ